MRFVPADNAPRERCPCCDHVSLPERGTYLICPICFWEDDGGDIDDLDTISGPNRMTLRAARKNFRRIGACAPEMLKHVLPDAKRREYAHLPRDVGLNFDENT